MNKEGNIGIFDSGIGGVTVFKEILKLLPNENYIYYSDSKNNPYGDKNEKEIIEICEKIVKYFIENNCKMIIIACNTASAIATKILREKYSEITIVAIEPAYKMVYDNEKESNTLIMATKGTITSEKFNLLYNKYNNQKTTIIQCAGLADIIELNKKEEIKKYLIENISKFKGKVKNVVLGCTHYPLIKKEIKEILGEVKFFDGHQRLAIHVKEILEENDCLGTKKGSISFLDTSNEKQKEKRFYQILKEGDIN